MNDATKLLTFSEKRPGMEVEMFAQRSMKSRIGGTRIVSYLTGEQLPRIC